MWLINNGIAYLYFDYELCEANSCLFSLYPPQ